MLRVITWPSQETGARLTPQEVAVLSDFFQQLTDFGQLSNGKYVGASEPIYWERLKGNN